MRRFIVVSREGPTKGDFSLNDLAGSAGRLDILCRCVGAALLLSHGIRHDTEIHLVITTEPNRPRTITIRGERVRYLNPDERSTASLLRIALNSPEEKETTPGITIRNIGLESLIREFKNTNLFLLEEKGSDARGLLSQANGTEFTFILGARDDIPSTLREDCISQGALSISVSPISLHAEHCITIVHNILDTIHCSK